MPIPIRYMGTKRVLAGRVYDVIKEQPDGPLLDLFSGMCAVAKHAVSDRQIWCNDIQHFSNKVARTFFCSDANMPDADEAVDLVRSYYSLNRDFLNKRFQSHRKIEAQLLRANTCDAVVEGWAHLEFELGNLRRKSAFQGEVGQHQNGPYLWFTKTYGNSYIGVEQAIDLDSLRYAFDALLGNELIHEEIFDMLLVALGLAISRVSNTTGHFAQFLNPNDRNFKRVVTQRRRSLFEEWYRALGEIKPMGSKKWRRQNRAYRMDANQLLNELTNQGHRPSIIYADPPYTSDQYSRYYHFLETVVLYDFPEVRGKGRYRNGRFQSPFSLATKIRGAMQKLICQSSELGSSLILSYPENGLLPNSKDQLLELLKRYYANVRIAYSTSTLHSSLGASKGEEKCHATELIFEANHSG